MSLNHPTMKPSQVVTAVEACIKAGIVPFVQSSPGLGKSSLAKLVAKNFGLKLIDLRLSQCAPEDLQGLPMKTLVKNSDGKDVERAAFTPFNTFPIEGDSIPEGYNGWLLFLDEFNSASKSVQAAAYKLTLDRMVGDHNLHKSVAIMAAGNLATDKAIVNTMSTAMQSRMAHIIMTVDKDEWIQWANETHQDYRVVGFINFQPHKLHHFKPDHQDLTFACPRTWEFASRIIKGKSEDEVRGLQTLLAGVLSAPIAMEFGAFCREFGKIPAIQDIEKDPDGTKIPPELSTRFAVLSMMSAHAEMTNIKPLSKYVARFKPEERIIFYRAAISRNTALRASPEVSAELVNVLKFVNG